MIKKIYIILILVLFNSISCEFSKSYDCVGYVYDADTNLPIERAYVCIFAQGYCCSGCEYTTKNGRFVVYADSVGYIWPFMSPPEQIFIEDSKPGYERVKIEYTDYSDFYLNKIQN